MFCKVNSAPKPELPVLTIFSPVQPDMGQEFSYGTKEESVSVLLRIMGKNVSFTVTFAAIKMRALAVPSSSIVKSA